MKDRKDFVVLIIVFSAVVVLSNMITAKYIEDRVNNKIRMEIEGLRYEIRQIQSNTTYSSSTTRKEKWNDVMAPTELAKYLDIELSQVYGIIDNTESAMPYTLIDGAYRFSKAAIDEWLKSRTNIITTD